MRVLGARIKDHGLDAADLLVGLRHVSFVLKIADTTHPAKDELGVLLFREIYRQAVVDSHLHTRLVCKNLTDCLFPFTDGEGLFLRAVSAYTDDDLIK